MKKRRLNEARKAIDATFPLLEEKRKSYEEERKNKNEEKEKELLFSEYRGEDGARYLVCLNPEKRKDDKIYREERIDKGKKKLEKILEKKMRQAHLQITAREALDRLDDIRLAKNEVAGRVFLCPVESEARHKEVLNTVGIKNIPHILTT